MFESEVLNFIAVLACAVCIAGGIGALYSAGLRLWAAGAPLDNSGNAHILTRVCSVVCFTACVCIVLFALWLMVPVFH